ncbi:MAG: Aspartate--tRNA(Asp/Asn) ligase [Chlamydiia bacterium]|nr:Aspartate--tRNA(Asp/Asn) ligase [Chlamydiia bacterium]MCH9616516.1 Aspartate--tRNA(Asp/Asn) ligase [Chlamydiia bacterium]MCH9629498.1 Aspartate--tRNA(Asp/Asn) ligase [Chlamydiia bacterium]
MHDQRTHSCGELSAANVKQTVILSGWVDRRRDHGGLIFIDLRDRYGITQLIIDPEKHEDGPKLRSEWVISIEGRVIPRAEGMANPKMKTGEIEVDVTKLCVLSKAKTPPFSICEDITEVSEDIRLKYRYLDIRRGDLLSNLKTRSDAMQAIRSSLIKHKFLEITTPVLGRATPEGARDYLVPSRIYPGSFYALPQSPQLYKQLLMMSGCDRYFQIATCFRDEDLRADRQPEFSQVDIEMSFGSFDELKKIVEGILTELFGNFEFAHMTHAECMEHYGTDKPDLRFEMPLMRVTDIGKRSDFAVFKEAPAIKALNVKGGAKLSRKDIEKYTTFVGGFGLKGLAWMKYVDGAFASSIVKFFNGDLLGELKQECEVEEGDLLLFAAAEESLVNQALDHLRRKLARDLEIIEDSYKFLWVTEFPLLEWDATDGRYYSMHHPFTSPNPEDIPLLVTDPGKVRSSGYDIVLNGFEIGGGSVRIHDFALQEKIFETLKLSMEEAREKFGFFIDALKYGTPPHLGIALGLDRLVMLLCKTENIRDVIAFPKTQKASDMMTECPNSVESHQLEELKINTITK